MRAAGSSAPRRSPAALAIAAFLLTAAPSGARVAAAPLNIESPNLGIRFMVPEHCSALEGPGTIEAICDPSGDAGKSTTMEAAIALKLEVVMLPTPDDRDQPVEVLVARYGFGQFEKDVPAAVCGDEARVKIEDAGQFFEGSRVVYNASVVCPEIRFLGLGARRAVVRTIVGPGKRYQVVARALATDFERLKPTIDAFFASLQIEPERSP